MFDDGRLEHAKDLLAREFPGARLEVELGQEAGAMALIVRGTRADSSKFVLIDTAPYLPDELLLQVRSLLGPG